MPAIERHQVEFRTKAANRDSRAFTIIALDRDAGDALQGFCEVGIGEVTDIDGRNGIHHTLAIPFDVHGCGQTLADTADGDDVDIIVLGTVLREGRACPSGQGQDRRAEHEHART